MRTEVRDVFVKSAVDTFSFLIKKGFKGPFVEEGWDVAVLFVGTNVALECIWDIKDDFVGCNITKVINGKPARGARRTKNGEIVSYLLHTWVSERVDIPDSFHNKISPRMSLEGQIPIILDNNLRLLKEYGQEIIADSPGVFPAS